ncbi:hypothetical protein EP7_000897 [Isosphaeraceae bacterium EP7]
MSGFIELRRCTDHGIFAIPFRDGMALRPVQLPDGAIVEVRPDEELGDSRIEVPSCFEVGHGGVPATRHHASLGLVIAHLPISGILQLLDGRIAAIYGAEVVPIAASHVSVG